MRKKYLPARFFVINLPTIEEIDDKKDDYREESA